MILIDTDMLAHRCFRALDHLHTSKGVPTGMEYGVLKLLKTLSQRICNKPDEPMVLCLEGSKQDRPMSYKSNRVKLPQSFYDRKNKLIEQLKCVYAWAQIETKEADQVMFSLSIQHKPCFIYSNDKDLFQAASESTVIVRSFESKLFFWTAENVFNRFRVRPSQYAIYKALTGDPSDGLKGISRIPRALAAEIARLAYTYGNTYEAALIAIKELWGVFSKGLRERVEEFCFNTNQFDFNYTLIKFDASLRVKIVQASKEPIQKYLDELEIASLQYTEETEF